jgi:hypothetical protein
MESESRVGGDRFPAPPAGFVAQGTYPLSFDAAWQRALTALARSRIAVATSDRASGRIVTDNVHAESRIGMIGVMPTTMARRYRLQILIARQGRGVTITPLAIIESSEAGQGQWINMTNDLAPVARQVEQWFLSQFEATS